MAVVTRPSSCHQRLACVYQPKRGRRGLGVGRPPGRGRCWNCTTYAVDPGRTGPADLAWEAEGATAQSPRETNQTYWFRLRRRRGSPPRPSPWAAIPLGRFAVASVDATVRYMASPPTKPLRARDAHVGYRHVVRARTSGARTSFGEVVRENGYGQFQVVKSLLGPYASMAEAYTHGFVVLAQVCAYRATP